MNYRRVQRLPPLDDRHLAERRMRIGVFVEIESELVDPEVKVAVEEWAALLERADCEVVRRAAPYDVGRVHRVRRTLSAAGAARAACMHPDIWRERASRPIAAAAGRGL